MIKVTNNTQYPTREVNRIVRVTLGYLDITHGLSVTVYHRKRSDNDFHGRHVAGHYRTWWYPARGEHGPQIMAGIAKPDVTPADWYPYQRVRDQGPTIQFADWREQLVALIAHEGQHHRQRGRRQGGRGYVEIECDHAAARCVGYWREDRAKKRAA